MESDRGGVRRSQTTVAVIGAGVSGCACAATLSACGVPVTVISSALDAVGQPSYGPVANGGDGGWDRIADTLAALPQPLRSVWLDACSAPEAEAPFFSVEPFFLVDRRMLSIETKRALEQMPGLEFRQGLVTELRYLPQGPGECGARANNDRHVRGHRVAIGTAFGEAIEVDMVILAVGMSLGGQVRVGDGVLPGGRYGETPGEGLRASLEALGAVFESRSVEIGPSFARWRLAGRNSEGSLAVDDVRGFPAEDCPPSLGRRVGVVPLRDRLEAAGGLSLTERTSAAIWPADYPPAAHWDGALRSDAMVVIESASAAARSWLSPDGAALGEVHCSTEVAGSSDLPGNTRAQLDGCDDDVLGDRPVASRLGHTITGQVIANMERGGRLLVEGRPALPVWVCGRASGAGDYLGSLASGVRTGREVAAARARVGGKSSVGDTAK